MHHLIHPIHPMDLSTSIRRSLRIKCIKEPLIQPTQTISMERITLVTITIPIHPIRISRVHTRSINSRHQLATTQTIPTISRSTIIHLSHQPIHIQTHRRHHNKIPTQARRTTVNGTTTHDRPRRVRRTKRYNLFKNPDKTVNLHELSKV